MPPRTRPVPAALFPLWLSLSLFLSIAGPAQSQTPPNATADAVEAIKAAYDRGDFPGAIALGRKAVAETPDDPVVHLWLGRAYGRKAQHAPIFTRYSWARKCKAEFEKAVALDPDFVNARWDLMTYHLRAPKIAGGDKALARREAEEILRLDPVRGERALAACVEKEKKEGAGAVATSPAPGE